MFFFIKSNLAKNNVEDILFPEFDFQLSHLRPTFRQFYIYIYYNLIVRVALRKNFESDKKQAKCIYVSGLVNCAFHYKKLFLPSRILKITQLRIHDCVVCDECI